MPSMLWEYTWCIHSLALSQMMVRTHSDRFVATRWINPNLDK
jgi:predicted ATPase